MSKNFEKLLDRITVTEYNYSGSPETCYILEDNESGLACFGTNGNPVWLGSREAAEVQGYYDGIELGCTYTLREFIGTVRRVDIPEIEDDDDFLALLNVGIGESEWLRTFMR